MIRDNVVLDQLNARGGYNDPTLMRKLEEKLNIPRYLDEPPKPIKLGGLSKEDRIGTAAEFRAFYNMNYDASKVDEIATIDLTTIGPQYAKKTCSYAVFIIMKTLILMGVTRSSERAKACRDLFMKIVAIPETFISKAIVYKMIESRDEDLSGYYYETICESIIDCMCTDEEKLQFHILMNLTASHTRNRVCSTLLEEYKGLTPYEFDKKIKERAKEITARTYYPQGRKGLSPLDKVATEIIDGRQTCEKLIAFYVKGAKIQAALLHKYQECTPKEMMLDVSSIYKEKTGKNSKSPEQILGYVGEILCQS